MNLTLLKQIGILSSLLGVLLGVITLIPFVGNISFLILMCLSSALIILLMVKYDALDILSVKEGVSLGALIGFISFIAFSIIYLPCVAILDKVFKLYSFYGISMIMNVGSFGVILMLTVFVAVLSAVINAFTAFLTFYGIELYNKLKQNEIKNQNYTDIYNNIDSSVDDEFRL